MSNNSSNTCIIKNKSIASLNEVYKLIIRESDITEEKVAKLKALNEIASKRGQTLAQMALSWILKDDEVTSVLIGASRPSQIEENIKLLGHTSFTEEELKLIDDITYNRI